VRKVAAFSQPRCAALQKAASPLGIDENYRVLAMNSVGVVFAQRIADNLQQAKLLNFKRTLDVGGALGTYTLAFLERNQGPPGRNPAQKLQRLSHAFG
jgi:hypothetical protein